MNTQIELIKLRIKKAAMLKDLNCSSGQIKEVTNEIKALEQTANLNTISASC